MKKQNIFVHLPLVLLWVLVISYIFVSQLAASVGGDDWVYRCTTWGNILPDARMNT